MEKLREAMANPSTRLAYLWSISLSILPVVTALVSFETDGKFAIWQMYARQLWLPTLVFEVATIAIAFRSGSKFSFTEQLSSANKTVKVLTGIWFVSLIIGTAFANIANVAIFSLVTWTVHVLFVLSIIHLFRRWSQDSNWSNTLAILMPAGSAFCWAIIILFVVVVGMESQHDWISALPGFTHIRHMGYFLMPALALSVGGIAVAQDHRLRNIHIALFSLNLGFVIWIGSRGPLFALLVTLPLAIVLFREIRRRETLLALLLAIVGGCLLSQLIPTPNHRAFNAIMRIEDGKSDDFDRLSSGRTELWGDALTMIPERPLFGHGGNQFRLLAPAARKNSNHPHNSVIQFIFDWGLIGAGAFMCLLTMLCLRIVSVARSNPECCLPFSLAAISIVVFSIIDGLFYYNLPIILFLTSALYVLIKGTRNEERVVTSGHSISVANDDRSLRWLA